MLARFKSGDILTLVTPANKIEKGELVYVGYTVEDFQSGVASVLCGFNGQLSSCSVSNRMIAPSNKEGLNTFQVKAKDFFNNTSEKSVQWTVLRPDTTSPVITFTNEIPKKVDQYTQIQLGYVVTDNTAVDEVKCGFDGNLIPCPVIGEIPYGNEVLGNHTFTVIAKDKKGNSQTASVSWETIFVDTNPPVITFLQYPTASVEINTAVHIEYRVVDHGIGLKEVRCGFDGDLKVCSDYGSVSFPNDSLGDHDFTIVAVDKYNNSSQEKKEWVTTREIRLVSQNVDVIEQNKVDILFVIDNSGSMAYEQENMAERMSTFFDFMGDLDWQIAVVTTDPRDSVNWGDGKFLPLTGTNKEYILDMSYTTEEAQMILGNTLQRSEMGSGSEQGIYATYRTIERSLNQTAFDDLFREDAAFATIIISDEDESANGFKNKANNLLSLVYDTWNGQKNFSFHSIITIPNDNQCLQGHGAKYGYAYHDLSKQLGAGTEGGSIIGSVCEPDYGTQLAKLGDSVRNMKKSLTMECSPIHNVSGDIIITKDGQPFTETYNVDGHKIIFNDWLPEGHYHLEYKCYL